MYSADEETMQVALNVQWNGSFIVDNPDQLTGEWDSVYDPHIQVMRVRFTRFAMFTTF